MVPLNSTYAPKIPKNNGTCMIGKNTLFSI